jgi:hypothetical protein
MFRRHLIAGYRDELRRERCAVEKGEDHAYSAPPPLPSDGSALSHVPGALKRATEKGWNNSGARTLYA